MLIPNKAYGFFLDEVKKLFNVELSKAKKDNLRNYKHKYWSAEDADGKQILRELNIGTVDARHFYLRNKNLIKYPNRETEESDEVIVKVLEKIGCFIPIGLMNDGLDHTSKAKILLQIFLAREHSDLFKEFPFLKVFDEPLNGPSVNKNQSARDTEEIATVGECSSNDECLETDIVRHTQEVNKISDDGIDKSAIWVNEILPAEDVSANDFEIPSNNYKLFSADENKVEELIRSYFECINTKDYKKALSHWSAVAQEKHFNNSLSAFERSIHYIDKLNYTSGLIANNHDFYFRYNQKMTMFHSEEVANFMSNYPPNKKIDIEYRNVSKFIKKAEKHEIYLSNESIAKFLDYSVIEQLHSYEKINQSNLRKLLPLLTKVEVYRAGVIRVIKTRLGRYLIESFGFEYNTYIQFDKL